MGPPKVRDFLNTLCLMPGHMRQPLDRWEKTTKRTPLWLDVHYFSKRVVDSPLL
jgi:hypothetical protein